MKTIKILSAFCMILFFGLTSAFAATPANGSSVKPVVAIRYQVSIHLTNDVSLCNLYLVQIVDEHGRLVAAPQAFRQGIPFYFFSERGPAKGTRTAQLVLNSEIRQFVCPNQIHTSPFSLTGTFLVGETYEFNLYPTTHATPPVPVIPGEGVSQVGKD
jgi:hypothetical protein